MTHKSPTANAQDVRATLTEQLDELVATHRLSSLSFVRIAGKPNSHGAFWSVNAQGDGKIGANAHTTAVLSDAIAEAISNLNVARTAAVVVPELACAA